MMIVFLAANSRLVATPEAGSYFAQAGTTAQQVPAPTASRFGADRREGIARPHSQEFYL